MLIGIRVCMKLINLIGSDHNYIYLSLSIFQSIDSRTLGFMLNMFTIKISSYSTSQVFEDVICHQFLGRGPASNTSKKISLKLTLVATTFFCISMTTLNENKNKKACSTDAIFGLLNPRLGCLISISLFFFRKKTKPTYRKCNKITFNKKHNSCFFIIPI